MDERPCANKVAVHVRSLVVHGILVFDSQDACVCMRVTVEIKLPSIWAEEASAEHVASLSQMVLVAAGEHHRKRMICLGL